MEEINAEKIEMSDFVYYQEKPEEVLKEKQFFRNHFFDITKLEKEDHNG